MKSNVKAVILLSLFLIVGCENSAFTWNDSVITYIDGDNLAH